MICYQFVSQKTLIYVWIKENLRKFLKLLKGRKRTRSRKATTDHLAFCLIFEKFMRDLCIIKWMISLKINSLNISVILEQDLGHTTISRVSRKLPPMKIATRIIAPRQLLPGWLSLGLLPPRKLSPRWLPSHYCFRTITLNIFAPWQYLL